MREENKMIDVHVPEHRIGGVRDFLIHLSTITVGLLIALSLEAGVEMIHHRNERIEAEEKIIGELSKNRETMRDSQTQIESEIKNFGRIVRFLEARSAGEAGDASALNLNFREGPPQDAAWRTASATGALNYVDYDTLQRFSIAYKEQDQFDEWQKRALGSLLDLLVLAGDNFDAAKVTTDEAKTALPLARSLLADLGGLKAIGRGTMQAYDHALKGH